MATEYKKAECLTGKVSMTGYYGGKGHGDCMQLTFTRPDDLFGEKHCDASNALKFWYLNMSKAQARELAVALFQYADGTLEEEND